MAAQKFVFLDPATGLYKEQTQNDSIVIPNGVNPTDAVNKSQLDFVSNNLSMLIDIERNDRTTAVMNESSARISADADLQAAIDAEASRALAAEGVLTSGLASEITRATAAEALLTSDLAAELTRANAAELALGVRIDVEEAARIAAVSAEEVARAAAVAAEEARAIAAEATLTADLAAEVTARGVALSMEETARVAADDALDTRLIILEGDDTVVNSVRYLIKNSTDTGSAAVAAEQAAREAADALIQAALDNEIIYRQQAVNSVTATVMNESARAIAAEAQLQSDMVSLANANNSAHMSMSQAISGLGGDLAIEIARAQAAEADLQSGIGTLTSNLALEVMDRQFGDTQTLNTAKAYADGIAQGLKFKDSVRIAMSTTADLGLGSVYTLPGQFGAMSAHLASFSYVLADGDRILITGEPNMPSADAGIYVVTGGGTSIARAADMATGADASGAYVFVEDGTLAFDANDWNAGSPAGGALNPTPHAYVCTAMKGNDVVGTAALRFTVFSRAESLSFSTGIKKVGQNVTLDVDTSAGLDANPFTNKLGIKLKNGGGLAVDAFGLAVAGDLAGGSASNADTMHSHSAITVVLASQVWAGFVKTDGTSADFDGTNVLGFVRHNDGAGNAEVVISGVVPTIQMGQLSMGLMGLSDGDTVYIGQWGTLSDYASVPSGKYAIPVGKKISGGLLVQIGTPILKA